MTPLNTHESHVAEAMLELLPPQVPGTLVLADGSYDDRDLHQEIGQRTDAHLLINLRGLAEHPDQLRHMGAERREAIAVQRQHPGLVRAVLREPDEVERIFSRLTCYGGGLGPLAAWVRRLERLRRWVGGKIILYHARLHVRTPGRRVRCSCAILFSRHPAPIGTGAG